jgi:hypothetical protein
MAWKIVAGPEAAHYEGYDGQIWRWRVANGDEERSILVKITRSAASAELVPERTATALGSQGQSEIEGLLEWYEPPLTIELGSWSETPYVVGGAPEHPDDAAAVEGIRAWFDSQGIDLFFDRQGGQILAPLVRRDQPLGAGIYGVGNTRREAAENVRTQFEAVRGAGGSETIVETVEVAGYSQPSLDERIEEIPEPIKTKLERAAAEFGWKIGFTREPDGSFRWFVFDRESGEPLQHGQADDWDDAKISSILDLYPSSDEGIGSS